MAAMVTALAIGIIRLNWLVSRKAIAPGAISNEIANIKPAAFNVATMVMDNAASSPKWRAATFNPIALACTGSKDCSRRSDHLAIKNKLTQVEIVRAVSKSAPSTPSMLPKNSAERPELVTRRVLWVFREIFLIGVSNVFMKDVFERCFRSFWEVLLKVIC